MRASDSTQLPFWASFLLTGYPKATVDRFRAKWTDVETTVFKKLDGQGFQRPCENNEDARSSPRCPYMLCINIAANCSIYASRSRLSKAKAALPKAQQLQSTIIRLVQQLETSVRELEELEDCDTRHGLDLDLWSLLNRAIQNGPADWVSVASHDWERFYAVASSQSRDGPGLADILDAVFQSSPSAHVDYTHVYSEISDRRSIQTAPLRIMEKRLEEASIRHLLTDDAVAVLASVAFGGEYSGTQVATIRWRNSKVDGHG